MRIIVFLAVAFILAGCTSVGTMGLVTNTGANPAELLENQHSYEELGPAEGTACRTSLLGVIPAGNSTFEKAVKEALEESGGDAMVNVTVSSSLYSFIPIYNVLAATCTTVKGTAIRIVEDHTAEAKND
jgi:hypothetical protein